MVFDPRQKGACQARCELACAAEAVSVGRLASFGFGRSVVKQRSATRLGLCWR